MSECGNIIVSEETYDYIFDYDAYLQSELRTMPGVCVEQVSPIWLVAHGPLLPGRRMNVGDFGYFTIPKLYGIMADTSSLDESGITAVLNQPVLNLKGQGVIIGFLDTGIDYTLKEFRTAGSDRGQTRILAVWDQTIQNESTENDEESSVFAYGSIYDRTDINRALEAYNNGMDPYEIVPTKDDNGHGTFLAGVAAASETGDYLGAAPESEILMVKLKPAKKYLKDYYLINENALAYEESDIMMGVRFLQYYAEKIGKPLVICFGLGTTSGPHTGLTPLSDVFGYYARQYASVIVTCTGNEGNERNHVSGSATSDSDPSTIEVSVGTGERGFTMEVWASTLDILSVSIESPTGEVIPRIPARVGKSSIFTFLLEGTQVSVDYRTIETVSGYEVIFIRFQNPAEGLWKINVYSLTNIIGEYNAWLPLQQFLSGDTFFLNSSPNITLVEPSPNASAITTGAYNHLTGAAYIYTGRGFTANGEIKPDIVAPGVDVYGPKAGGGYMYMTGTSIAAAHVAGASALVLTWGRFFGNQPYAAGVEVKSILIRGAARDISRIYPDPVFGYGKLDLINSFEQLRRT